MIETRAWNELISQPEAAAVAMRAFNLIFEYRTSSGEEKTRRVFARSVCERTNSIFLRQDGRPHTYTHGR